MSATRVHCFCGVSGIFKAGSCSLAGHAVLGFFLSGLFFQRVDFVITPLCNLNPETQVSTKSISRVSRRILRPRPIHLDHVHVVAHVAGHQSYDVKIPTTEGRAAEAAVLANTDGRRPVACRSLPTLWGGASYVDSWSRGWNLFFKHVYSSFLLLPVRHLLLLAMHLLLVASCYY